MKKFFSLMLAVLLLVSALPFQAFAAGPGNITMELYLDGQQIDSETVYVNCIGDPFGEPDIQAWGVLVYPEYFNDTANYTYVGGGATTDAVVEGWTTQAKFVSVNPCANGHAWGDWNVTKAATCTEDGSRERVCANNAEHKETETIAKLGHAFGEYKVTKEATCKEAGEEVATCANDATHKDIRPIAKLTGADVHNYVNGVCSVCGDKESFGLTFKYKNENGTWTSSIVSVKVGDRINAPEVPSVSGLKHTGWDNNLQDGWTRYYIGMPTEYTATYVESTDDGLVDLTVYAYYYVDGEYHHKAKLFVEEFEESKHNNMVPWIYSEGISQVKSALAAEHGADGYQWNPTVFYNCYDDGEISTWGDLIANGNKAVYVKINSKKAIEATVLLHIHTKQEYAIARTVKMAGYTAGDFVSYNEALAKVKNYYTGSKLEMSDLYDEGDWEDLMDGLKSSGSKTVKVEHNGTTEIHVIVKNATSKTSSNADPSNPKTGDYITIAVGTMAMAAAALVTLAELKKRKMI